MHVKLSYMRVKVSYMLTQGICISSMQYSANAVPMMICEACLLTWQLTMHVHAACVAVISDQQHMLLLATHNLGLNMLEHCA